MSNLEFLNYLNRTPYKEVLACLALEEGLNPHQVLDRLIDRKVGTTIWDLKRALTEMECGGLIASVNNSFYFHENWLKELVLFLDEFEESSKELDLCQLMLGKAQNEVFSSKKEKH